jgi:hypothetical protein
MKGIGIQMFILCAIIRRRISDSEWETSRSYNSQNYGYHDDECSCTTLCLHHHLTTWAVVPNNQPAFSALQLHDVATGLCALSV